MQYISKANSQPGPKLLPHIGIYITVIIIFYFSSITELGMLLKEAEVQ